MENTLKEVGENVQGVEKLIPTTDYFSMDTGLNVQIPATFNKTDIKSRCLDLNSRLTDEERVSFEGKVIPFEVQEEVLKRPVAEDESGLKTFISEGAKSFWNTTQDVLTYPYQWGIQKSAGFGVNVAEKVAKINDFPVNKNDKEKSVLEVEEELNPNYDDTKFKLKEAEMWSPAWWGQGTGNMTASLVFPIFTGTVPYTALSFGMMTDTDVTRARLERGDSLLEANAKGSSSGAAISAFELFHINTLTKRVILPRVQRYLARFATGSVVEVAQQGVEDVAMGDADTRTPEQKRDAYISSIVFGGMGDVVGHIARDTATRKVQKEIKKKALKEGYSETLATELAQTSMVDENPDYEKISQELKKEANQRQDFRRGEVYEEFIKQGDTPEIASKKANELVPSVEEVESEILEDLEKGTLLTEDEKENLKQAYFEAVNSAGEEAGLYLAANEEIRNLIQKAGRSEQEAKDYAAYMTGLMIKDYQILKDTGFEGTFEDVKDKFYKLNKITDYEYEAWADYDARNQTKSEFNEEQDMVEGKPSHRLFSKIITNNRGDKRVYVNPQKSELSQILDNKGQRILINKETGKYYSIDSDKNIHFDIIDTLLDNNKDGLKQEDVKDFNSRLKTYYNKYEAIYLTKRSGVTYEGHPLIYTSDGNFSHYKIPHYETLEEARDIYNDYKKNESIGKLLGEFDELSTVRYLKRKAEEEIVVWSNSQLPSASDRVNKAKKQLEKLEKQENELLAKEEDGKLYSRTLSVPQQYKYKGKLVSQIKKDRDIIEDAVYAFDSGKTWAQYEQEVSEAFKKISRDLVIVTSGEKVAKEQLSEEEIAEVDENVYSRKGEIEGDSYVQELSEVGGAKYEYAANKISRLEYEMMTDAYKRILSNKIDFGSFEKVNRSLGGKLYSKTEGEAIGSYDELTREVELFKGQNPSTLMHELSHHFLLNHLNLMESMGLKDRNSEVFKFLSEVGGHEINSVNDMTDADKENLTEAFINYMNTNEAPNLATKSIFQRAKEWVIDQYRIHQTDASPEIREYFDGLISRESAMPDVSSMVNRTAEIREILKQAINGEQVSFKGLGKKELEQLQKALHTRIRRKGKSLRDELIEAGGIKEGTELAKALGFDVLKKDKMFSTKETAIESENELIEWLAEKGYIVGVQEGESYSDTERRWEEVLSLIDNAENTYTVKESMINNERETAIRNQAHAQEIVDEILKDNALGLKDINDLDNLLTRTISKKDDVDIIKVNTNAVRYLNERMKSLTKDTKELLRNKDKEFKSKREEQYQAQNDLKDFIRNLPINGKHKVSLMGNIQRVKDYDSLQKVVNEIKPRVQGFIEQEIKTLLSNKIDAIVRSSKPKERKKQKFNYEYNTFFEELRELNKLTKEKAQDKLKEVFELLGEDTEFEGTDLLKNMFLTYKSNGMNTSVELMKELSDELDNIYNEALQDRMDTLERLGQEREAKIKEAVDYIENTKAVNKLNQKLLKMTNLNSNLSELFGKKWADKHKMDSLLIKQDMETNKALDEVIREGKDIYGLKNREEFVKLANDMRVAKEEYTLNNYRDDMSEQISKMQLIDIYLTIKNKGSAEAYRDLYEDFDELDNQTTTQIEDLLSNLTEEDKKFADMLQKRVNDLYKAENKVYVKLYGIDMPKHDNYWMRTSERAERPLMDIKQFMNVDMLPSFMKERSKTPSVRPDDAFKKFARRIHDSKYMTEVFEQYKDIYDLVHSNRVKKAIVKKYDNDRYKVLNQSLKRISLGGVNDSYNELNNMLGKAITNWVVSKISISESVFVKQMLSFTNYMENIPVSDFLKYQAEFWANPKEAVGFMKNFAGEYLDHRFKSGIQNEVLQRIMQSKPEDYSKATGMYQKYLNFVTAPVRFGDIGAIYLGGYARARYLLEQGVPLEKARKTFIEETESAQQSGNKAELSEFQHNALWRVFTAFKNTNLQYMRKMQDSYIQFTRGEISAQQFGKTWGNYMVIQSVLYQVATNFFTWLRDDDDEELNWFKDVWMRILTAPVAGFPIIGDITEGVFAENYWGLNISGKQDMEAFIGAARDAIDGEFDAKKIAKGSMSLISFFRPVPDRVIKGVINLVED